MRPACHILILALLLGAVSARAAEPAAEVVFVHGDAQAVDMAGERRGLDEGDPVYEGDTLVTAAATYLDLSFSDGSSVFLTSNSELQIETFHYRGEVRAVPGSTTVAEPRVESAFFSLLQGAFHAVTGLVGSVDRDQYRVRTPIATSE